jgi:transposase-like protein
MWLTPRSVRRPPVRWERNTGSAGPAQVQHAATCRSQFRVTVGTIFEKSHVPLHQWLQAFYLLAGSKKGTSSTARWA